MWLDARLKVLIHEKQNRKIESMHGQCFPVPNPVIANGRKKRSADQDGKSADNAGLRRVCKQHVDEFKEKVCRV